MAEVVWSPRAIEDVQAIAAYIAEDSLAYAKSVAQKIVASTRRLATFPMSGRMVPEFGDENIREVFAYSYRIIYRVEGETVTIAAVVHGRRPVELEVQP
ncbi:MAG: type II toxin-antitoxin system RelE/ParE family toxin [Pyrinomonadaceae bacterium]